MDASRFDSVARQFAGRRISRRQALATGGAGLAASALAAAGLSAASAQDATPDQAAPVEKVPFLFVQTFQSGIITPTEGVDGRYTVTLEQGAGQTIYFSDRPERIVGVTDTPQFLEGLGFVPDNPPNAALVVETAPGETDVAVVELFNPVYDPVSQSVTYEVEVLENWQDDLEIGFTEAPTDLAALAPAFGSAQLLIDDCPNLEIHCLYGEKVGGFPNQEMCWNYSLCIPCEPYGHAQPDRCSVVHYWMDKCTSTFPVECHMGTGGCRVSWDWSLSGLLCPSL